MDKYLANLATESINENTKGIDLCSTKEMVELINREDQTVAIAVAEESKVIAKAVDEIYIRLQNGGRLIYLGAGTSGRLGVLDASECVPTFGVSPELVQGFIAGGDTALRTAVEGAEDSLNLGINQLEEIGFSNKDVLVGITASGSANFVLSAVKYATGIGAFSIGLCTNKNSKLESLCDICISPNVGAEVILGSTRMKSGTAQKMVLNILSTCTMVKLGKVYDNLMVDLKASNKKLEDRAIRLIIHATNVNTQQAKHALKEADGWVKLAILMIKTSINAKTAKKILQNSNGHLATAILQAENKEC
ncbi:MAG: N-acetylmuramic acid 6-phosphate etherase [Clostridia bacterium]